MRNWFPRLTVSKGVSMDNGMRSWHISLSNLPLGKILFVIFLICTKIAEVSICHHLILIFFVCIPEKKNNCINCFISKMNKVFNIINNHSIPLFLWFKSRGPITLIQSAISQPRSSRNPGFNPCYLIQSVNTNLIQQWFTEMIW